MTEIETWRPVRDFESEYQISSFGNVRRIGKATGAKVGRILKPGINRKDGGYLFVFLYKNCLSERRYVHRIVADAFHGRAPDGHEVNHKDGDNQNCRADNLEWVTKKENAVHAVKVLRRGNIGRTGAANPLSRRYLITPPSGRPFFAVGLNAVCKKYGLDTGSMTKVAQGKWAHHHDWLCAYADDGRPGNASKNLTSRALE